MSSIADVINQGPPMSLEVARYFLALDFTPSQHARYAELSGKAQTGRLSEEEELELDDMLDVNSVLSIFQSKARVVLKPSSPTA